MQRVFSVYYFIFFVAAASTQPFISLYLHTKGLNAAQIGILLAAGSGAGILAQPVLGALNDHARDPRRILLLSSALSPVAFAGYALTRQFWPLLVVSIILAVVQSASPIADAMAVQEAAKSGFTYGQIRLWGALSFALTTMIAGYAYNMVGIGASFVVYAVLSAVLVLNTSYLPKQRPAQAKENMLRGIWTVAREKSLTTFILICFILSIAIAVNFSFLPLYYQDLHYPMRWVGLNFTIAALVEVPFFFVSGQLAKRFGLIPVVAAASLLYTLKYFVMALAPSASVVIGIQVLDGIAYALYWSAAVQLVAELAPVERTATAQTLFGAIAGGLGNILGSSLGGALLAAFGPIVMYEFTAALGAASFLGFLAFAKFGLRHKGCANDPSETTA